MLCTNCVAAMILLYLLLLSSICLFVQSIHNEIAILTNTYMDIHSYLMAPHVNHTVFSSDVITYNV